jgi:hypothetical protein
MATTQKKENFITSPAPLQEPKITWNCMFDSFYIIFKMMYNKWFSCLAVLSVHMLNL